MNNKYRIKVSFFYKAFKLALIACSFLVVQTSYVSAQVTVVNYDFASAVGCASTPLTTAPGVVSAFTATTTCTNPGGTASTVPPAFVANVANQSVSVNGVNLTTQSFDFALSGLSSFSSYEVFFQTQRSGTGPPNGALLYSTDGVNYTNFANFANPTPFSAGFAFDLSTVTAINAQPTVFFRLLMSGATNANGTIRIDNFQVRALVPSAAAGTVAGRVINDKGRGLKFVTLMIVGRGLPEPLYATTNSFGNYRFEDIPVGETYVLQVFSKRYSFDQSSMVINLDDSIADANFIRSESW